MYEIGVYLVSFGLLNTNKACLIFETEPSNPFAFRGGSNPINVNGYKNHWSTILSSMIAETSVSLPTISWPMMDPTLIVLPISCSLLEELRFAHLVALVLQRWIHESLFDMELLQETDCVERVGDVGLMHYGLGEYGMCIWNRKAHVVSLVLAFVNNKRDCPRDAAGH
ncbi:hypothetical protein Tco_1556330 [Tanacetum coccineum]